MTVRRWARGGLQGLCGLLLAGLTTGCLELRETPEQDANPCTACHGSSERNTDALSQSAPPFDLSGNTDPSAPGVGAHQQHLSASDSFDSVDCSTCHLVPSETGDDGHADTAGPAELVFSALATHGGLSPSYDPATGTCSDTYCHGAESGRWTEPATDSCGTCHGLPPMSPHPAVAECQQCHNTVIDAQGRFVDRSLHMNGSVDIALSTDSCASCHGLPPAPPHSTSTDCAACHGDVVDADKNIINASLHRNGTVDVSVSGGGGGACSGCHGSSNSAAPPTDLDGNTSSDAVGAHIAHLQAGTRSMAVACNTCHVVPKDVGAPGHMDGDGQAELTFSGVATQNGATPAFDGKACANTYCHGGLAGGTTPAPEWNATGGPLDCVSCHGYPPPAPHIQDSACSVCHANVKPDDSFSNPSLHVNGRIDVF